MVRSIGIFREKLKNKECVVGPFMKTSDPMFVEVAGIAGFDFAILDMEHGPNGISEQQNNIRAAQLRNMLPIVRVEGIDENQISSALDIGASGIQVPQIRNADDARKVVQYAKFYPKGMRGVCRFVRAANYSEMEKSEYFQQSNDMLIIIQLEGVDAISNLDEILEVDDIDIIFIGPYDLSQSLGVPGEVAHPLVIEKMKCIVEKARKKGMVVGTFVDNIEMLKMWKDSGIQYLSYNVDAGIFMEACQHIVNESKVGII